MASHLPNHLTLLRILAIVPLAAFMVIEKPWAAWGAFIIFVAAGLTDWLDGYLARKLGSVSDVGKFLDPIADKLLVAAVLILLVAGRHLDGWNLVPVLVILGREFIVSGLREYLGQKSVSLPVTRLANPGPRPSGRLDGQRDRHRADLDRRRPDGDHGLDLPARGHAASGAFLTPMGRTAFLPAAH